jgi:hypothetical protein
MVLTGQKDKLKSYILHTECIIYFGGEIKSFSLPYRLLLGAGNRYNFHTRPNYFKYLYFYALKWNTIAPLKKQFYHELMT